ncbi:alpha/beta-hydrolase [Pleurotus eryngii]|uniref:Alpha/beta-hydrolase n=1 Tax=Pleurotus eryngii TaxID=5323 RepID=A0A9P6A990_PLEER|nr:alpha/beta-hydrolase [Pleurotus eryngii]
MFNLDVQSFVFAGATPNVVRPALPPTNASLSLRITAKRYRDTKTQKRQGNVPSPGENEGLTLLFLHCVGAHKEQWEPTIQAIFERASNIREAWAFDWQNHGDAAVLNKNALSERKDDGAVTVYDWAAAISAFVRSDHVKGHNIIPIGHSAGAATAILTTKYLPKPYPAIILVEPSVVAKELFEATIDDRMEQMEFVVRMTMDRRDHWASKDEAFAWLSKRYPWSTWDTRVVKLLADHGLEQHEDGARLKCQRKHEAVSYTQVEGPFEAADLLTTISKTIPIHLVWGENEDIIPEIIRDSLSDASAGKSVTSTSRVVEDAGHMVVQEKPNELANAICEVLHDCRLPCPVQTKL